MFVIKSLCPFRIDPCERDQGQTESIMRENKIIKQLLKDSVMSADTTD